MGNKEDWEELENWNKNKELETKDKYGVDINNIKVDTEKVYKFSGILNKITKKVYIIMCIFFALIVIFAIGLFAYNYKKLNDSLDVDVLKEIKTYNGLEFEIERQETDEKGNGKYYLMCKKEPNIKCLAIKDGGRLIEDCSDNVYKYYFENWENNYKENFNVEEYRDENGLLNYSLWIEVNDFLKIDEVIEESYKLKETIIEDYSLMLPIEIRDNKYKGVVYLNQSIEETKNVAKRDYVIWHKDNNYNIDRISKEDIEKYYKPENLNVYLNNKEIGDLKAFYKFETDTYFINTIPIINALELETEFDWTRWNKCICI